MARKPVKFRWQLHLYDSGAYEAAQAKAKKRAAETAASVPEGGDEVDKGAVEI